MVIEVILGKDDNVEVDGGDVTQRVGNRIC